METKIFIDGNGIEETFEHFNERINAIAYRLQEIEEWHVAADARLDALESARPAPEEETNDNCADACHPDCPYHDYWNNCAYGFKPTKLQPAPQRHDCIKCGKWYEDDGTHVCPAKPAPAEATGAEVKRAKVAEALLAEVLRNPAGYERDMLYESGILKQIAFMLTTEGHANAATLLDRMAAVLESADEK